MSSYQSWFRRDDRLPLLNRDWHGPGRLVAQGSVIALEVPAGKRTPRSTRSVASGGGSANAGSCQSWFNVEDRLSSKLPLAEAGLDCCAWIPPAPRLGIRRARLRVDLGSAGMKPFFEGEYACKRHLRSRPPAWREKAGLPLSNSRLTCLFVATCPRFRKTGTRASPHSDLWGILR